MFKHMFKINKKLQESLHFFPIFLRGYLFHFFQYFCRFFFPFCPFSLFFFFPFFFFFFFFSPSPKGLAPKGARGPPGREAWCLGTIGPMVNPSQVTSPFLSNLSFVSFCPSLFLVFFLSVGFVPSCLPQFWLFFFFPYLFLFSTSSSLFLFLLFLLLLLPPFLFFLPLFSFFSSLPASKRPSVPPSGARVLGHYLTPCSPHWPPQ